MLLVTAIYKKRNECLLKKMKLHGYFPQHIVKQQIHSISQSFRFHADQFSKHLRVLPQICNSWNYSILPFPTIKR